MIALRNFEIHSEILTGDAKEPAQRVADTLGLKVIAKATSTDKIEHLTALKQAGQHTLMVGDGLNDTAALAVAHASIAPSTALEASRNAVRTLYY